MCGKVHQKKECVGKNKMREEMLVDKEKRGEERGALVKDLNTNEIDRKNVKQIDDLTITK